MQNNLVKSLLWIKVNASHQSSTLNHFFSCPDGSLRQLYTYPCTYLTDYKDLLLFDIKERPQRLVTFKTYDQSDDETWPDQQKCNDKDKYKDNDNAKDKYI